MKTHALLSAAVIGLMHTSLALAQSGQPWLEDRRYGEGIGIRTGNLELHPSIAGQVGYDSNYYQRSGDPGEEVLDAMRYRLTPSLTLSTLGRRRTAEQGPGAPPKLRFSSRLGAGLNHVQVLDGPNQTFVDGDAGVNFDILPEAHFGADVHGTVRRHVEASNTAEAVDIFGDAAFNRWVYEAGAGMTWRPGPRVLTWRLGYRLRYTNFARSEFDDLDNAQHIIETQGRWRFLPRTAFLYDGQLAFVRYSEAGVQQEGNPITTRVGLNGLVTNHFGLLAMVGWMSTFYEDDEDFDSAVGQLELTWYPTPKPRLESGSAATGLSSIAGGYVRDVQNSYLGNYTQRDRGYITASYFAAGAFVMSLNGGVSRLRRPINPLLGAFTEWRADATAFGEYRASDIFGVNLTLRYNAALSDVALPLSNGEDNLKFRRFEAYLGARLFW